MTYDIRKSDGTKLVDLDNEIIDTETISGIGLIGRLTANYGETQSNNFVHLVENFASKNFPENPLKGQLCYKLEDDGEGSLFVCVDSGLPEWKKLPLVIVSTAKPVDGNYVSGDMWYDTTKHSFNMYDSTLGDWIIVGPNNYNDTKTIVESITTEEAEASSYICSLDLPQKNAGYLITSKIIGKEVNKVNVDTMSVSKIYGCIIKALINVYYDGQKWNYEIIEEPDYEIIGSNVDTWSVNIVINDIDNSDSKKLEIEVSGSPTTTSKVVKWIGKMDILKVSQEEIINGD